MKKIIILVLFSVFSCFQTVRDEKISTKSAIGLELSVSFENDVGEDLFKEWKERMLKASETLFKVTEGQFFIEKCSIEDKSSRGQIVIYQDCENLDYAIPKLGAPAHTIQCGTPFFRIGSLGHLDGGKRTVWKMGTVIAHELGHALFGLPDERDNSHVKGIECKNCIMGTNPERFCGPDDHEGKIKQNCKDVIAKLYEGKVKFPNKDYKSSMKAPETKFSVINRTEKESSPEFSPLTKEEEQLIKEMENKGRAFSIKVAFQGDADKDLLNRWMRYVMVLDQMLRHITGNRLFISKCVIEDNCEDGDIVIESGTENSGVLKTGKAMWTKTKTESGLGWLISGATYIERFGRAFFAEKLKLDGEHSHSKTCVFNLKEWGSFKFTMCDKSSVTNGSSCVERFMKTWEIDNSDKGNVIALPQTRFQVVNKSKKPN